MADEAEQTADSGGELDTSTYEVIRKRLMEQGAGLQERVQRLNARRLEIFGGAETTLLSTERVRTEHNCVPRDIVSVSADALLLGYQVFMGLKSETAVSDVFARIAFQGEHLEPCDYQLLNDPTFAKDFRELFQYYKDAKLLQLRRTDTHLLMVFRTGERASDIKVLRWGIRNGEISYIDNRGERDHVYPPRYDFEWLRTTREDHVLGMHPHVNVADTIFVECTEGDLTIKVEDNTETGAGIYAEDVDDASQSLDDAEISYADLEGLILLRIRPYREQAHRYIIYNKLTREALRIDDLGSSCQQLPEGHGIVFPSGYYLADGSHKTFPVDVADMEFIRAIRAPNGEDVAYVFHHRVDGIYTIIQYNLISREVAQPQQCNGYSLFPDGRMVLVRSDPEPQRLHAMQIWQTPFCDEEHAEAGIEESCFLATLGNRELVRGISDLLQIGRMIANQQPSSAVYEDLLKTIGRSFDSYHWLGHDESFALHEQLQEIRQTTNTVIGEFEKVQQIRAQSAQQVAQLQSEGKELFRDIALEEQHVIGDFVGCLDRLRALRGRIDTARGLRYVDQESLRELEDEVVKHQDELSRGAVGCLQQEGSLAPYTDGIAEQLTAAETIETVHAGEPIAEQLGRISDELDLLMETVSGLQIDDTTARTQILEDISAVYGRLNRARAVLGSRRQELGTREGRAEFGAQFTLLSQTVSNYLALADEPGKCDDLLAKLMLQLEELEAKFIEFDAFAAQLGDKREEIYEAFSTRKQQLLDERQRRAQQLARSAERIISSVRKRAMGFGELDELNSYLATDPMVMKLKGLIASLGELGDSVKADDCSSQFKSIREDAVRHLRDQSELFEGDTIKLGRHKFSVNRQPLELTMLPRDDGMTFHLSGTDYYGAISDPDFLATETFWNQELPSENAQVYRAEYLAWSILEAAEHERDGLSMAILRQAALEPEGLNELVRRTAAQRYEEGYERGLHDADAGAILTSLLQLCENSGLLRHPAAARAAALLWWAGGTNGEREALRRRCRSLMRLGRAYGLSDEHRLVAAQLAERIAAYMQSIGVAIEETRAAAAGRYALEQLGADGEHFACSGEADQLIRHFEEHLDLKQLRNDFDEDLRELGEDTAALRGLVSAWLTRYCRAERPGSLAVVDEAVAVTLTREQMTHEVIGARTACTVEGLLGSHPRITENRMELRLDEFLPRLEHHHKQTIPAYRAYLALRKRLIEHERRALRLEEFKPHVLTSFVRNRLINEVYLPLVGDNLAKQMGAVGDSKRTDLMGLLLLISPPGYGKTTLMEYIASILGLTFMKINGPAIGHQATSIDPAAAPNATAAQELEKLNLALEMGNNVMLYLDDIQHCNPELLQKFISLCDGQRRIEGVWKGRSKTYDLRGKKVCVVMAGNPYTESGDKFQIPDMLANRADTYNLGDILGGAREAFELSYLENCLTVNPVLNPVASRSQQDFYKLLRIAEGDDEARTQLEHPYSAIELEEICQVLRHLRRVQAVLLQVNQLYIESASMSDDDRTEPAFKLQGSYRNMAKLAEKVVAVMNEAELQQLILDHYEQESQTLTSAAEANLLRFYQMVDAMTPERTERWRHICAGFARRQELGDDDDPMQIAVRQLVSMNQGLGELGGAIAAAASAADTRSAKAIASQLKAATAGATALAERLAPSLEKLAQLELKIDPKVEVINTLPKYYSKMYQQHIEVIEQTLSPALATLGRHLDSSEAIKQNLKALVDYLRKLIGKQANAEHLDLNEEEDKGEI